MLKQNRSAPVAVEKQVAILYATIHDYLVNIKVPAVAEYEKGLYEYLDTDAAGASVMETIRTTGKLEKGRRGSSEGCAVRLHRELYQGTLTGRRRNAWQVP